MSLKIMRSTGIRVAITLVASAWATSGFALVPETGIRSGSGFTESKIARHKSSLMTAGSMESKSGSDMLDRVVNFEHQKLEDQRERFLEAEKALQRRQLTRFRQLLPGLVDYPLYPYLRYQDLQRRISKAKKEELQDFFADYASQPVARKLRDNLLRRAARQGQWKRFLAFYTPQTSPRLQCYYSDALIRTGNSESAYPEIEKLWLTGSSLPRNCDRVFNHWKSAGKLTPELAWGRLELALEGGNRSLATYLVRSLPPRDRKLAKTWIKLHRDPSRLDRYQSKLVNSTHAKAPVILREVIRRLAKTEPQQAAGYLASEDIHDLVSKQDYHELVQALAISLSRNHLPGAEYWFAQVPDGKLTDLGREWRIRVALRESQWQTALNTMNGLPAGEQESDRWRYWRARVLEELDLKTTARAQFTRLAKHRSYYGFLAADRMGLPYAMRDRPHLPSAAELFTIVQRPDVRRTRELLQLGRVVEARREWLQSTRSMTNGERVDASKLAQFWGWADQSILTMASTDNRDDMDLRFPLLFQDEVMSHSQQASIDPAWTYGVIRRESAFVRDARSSKGAVGLMQLMPATAKRMSRSISKIKYRGSSQLIHADTNLALGTHYLNKMLERFGGQTVLATAAYNAGEHRVDRWLPKENELDAERWIENIPFRETREYVASVLAFTIIYSDRLGMEGQRLSELMTNVVPRDSMLAKRSKDKEQLAALENRKTSIR